MSFSKRFIIKSQPEEGLFTHFLARNDEDGEAVFWRLNLLMWGMIGIFGFMLMVPMLGLRSAIIVAPVRTLSGFAVTFLLREFYRRTPWRRLRLGFLVFAVATVCLILAVLESNASELLLETVIGNPAPMAWQPVITPMGVTIRFVIFSSWSILYFVVKLWSESINIKLKFARSEAESRAAELRQLQAQVNPHFLFNALNSILAEKEDARVVERIGQSLADFLRYSLRHQHGLVPLGDELDQLERFLQIEQVRFEERMQYRIETDAAARAFPIPPALVQPLLENACKYGRATGPRLLQVRVTARRRAGGLEVVVANTGHWRAEPVDHSTGTGLANLRRRLDLLSGGHARLAHDASDGWVRATLHWPAGASAPRTTEVQP
jgi:signal transduction histidine kinase